MERIAKLLFAAIFLSIFSYIMVFSFVSMSGNGGEYWGFDGYVEPYVAASRAFDAGDTRFLKVDLVESNGNRLDNIPHVGACENHPFGVLNAFRPTIVGPMHDRDSIPLARKFALAYNSQMEWRLRNEKYFVCKRAAAE